MSGLSILTKEGSSDRLLNRIRLRLIKAGEKGATARVLANKMHMDGTRPIMERLDYLVQNNLVSVRVGGIYNGLPTHHYTWVGPTEWME